MAGRRPRQPADEARPDRVFRTDYPEVNVEASLIILASITRYHLKRVRLTAILCAIVFSHRNDPMENISDRPNLLALTAEIVASFVGNNTVATGDLPALIKSVFGVAELGRPGRGTKAPEVLTPAVPIKRSVGTDYIVCLEDGKKLKMLKRHLATRYNMTPAEYRRRWGLAGGLPDGGAGLCRAALDAGQADRPRPQAGSRTCTGGTRAEAGCCTAPGSGGRAQEERLSAYAEQRNIRR